MRVNQSYYFTPVNKSQYENVLAATGIQLSELLFSNPFSKELVSYQKNPDYKQLTAFTLNSAEIYSRLAMQVALVALICFKPRVGIPLAALALVPKLIHRACVDLRKYFPPGTEATLSCESKNCYLSKSKNILFFDAVEDQKALKSIIDSRKLLIPHWVNEAESFPRDLGEFFKDKLSSVKQFIVVSLNKKEGQGFELYAYSFDKSDLGFSKPLHVFLKDNNGSGESTIGIDGSYRLSLENMSYELLLIQGDLEGQEKQAVDDGFRNSSPIAYSKYKHVKLDINFTLPE